ncbi:MAG: hypothetical protein K0U93_03100 [Gammaproteobacteria bacterium]|nr:hypothetical protein [Gammaproteobacteria bacterium]
MFTAAQKRDLRALCALMIPASAQYGVPGADDALIFADIVDSVGPDAAAVSEALQTLTSMSRGSFADLDVEESASVAEAFLSAGGNSVGAVSRAVLQCYYRDDRVMRSLDLEARPPFPQGHTLVEGDWSLLDVVRARRPMWRDVR